MGCVRKEAILFLIINALQVQCRTVLMIPNMNGTGNQMNQKLEKGPENCSYDEDCKDNQKCRIIDGVNTCICADGLSGRNCEVKEWCEERFPNCKGQNGTCDYIRAKRSVDCICAPGKKLHPIENRCRDSCSVNADCMNYGICEGNFCSCRSGLMGDKCETIFLCTASQFYNGCEVTGGKCYYDFTSNNAACECPTNKKYHDLRQFCIDCNCGSAGTCYFEVGRTTCACLPGFANNGGTCVECNCGPYDSCYFDNRQKRCTCQSFATEKNGLCIILETTSLDDTTIIPSTILPSTIQECNCGPYGLCYFQDGHKQCACKSFATEKNGVCIIKETILPENTTINARSSTPVPYTTTVSSSISSSTAQDICNENNCVHGKCEITGGNFKCRCNNGFTGQKCDVKIQIEPKIPDLWRILSVGIIFAIFILLSGVLCSTTRILTKISKK